MSKVDAATYVAFDELELAARAFKAAIEKFGNVYEPNTVGLDYWAEGIDDVLSEIEQDMEENQ